MPARSHSFPAILSRLAEASNVSKERALYDLVEWATADASIHGKALPIFEEFANTSRVVYTLAPAIRGLGVIRGVAEAQRRWLQLLQDADARLVRLGLGELGRTRDVGMLAPIAAMLEHADRAVRVDAVTALGHLRLAEAFPILVECLGPVELRPHAVEALASLGDPRAMPALTGLLEDRTDAWPIDNHGPMMTVGEVAGEALARLKKSLGC